MTDRSPDPHTTAALQGAALASAFVAAEHRRRRYAVLNHAVRNGLGLALFLALWEAIPRLVPNLNILMFPPPSMVVETALPMILSGELAENIGISLVRAGVGFLLAAIFGIAAGLLTARIRLLNELSEPVLHGFRSVPVIALVPISVLWFGIGESAKIALVAIGGFFPIWINSFIGVRDVHPTYLRSAACLGATTHRTMLFVILPAALPFILAGLRQAIAVSFIVLVAAELSGATSGVAYMMSRGHQLFRVDIMFIGLFTLAALGFTADRLFVMTARRLFPWYETAR
ncbi:MAG: ABC transporter permease [Pseudomonadota bacterium]